MRLWVPRNLFLTYICLRNTNSNPVEEKDMKTKKYLRLN